MIDITRTENSKPYMHFQSSYNKALAKNQSNINAICISSFNKANQEVNSRFVNLNYIKNDKWFFYTNYNSPKAQEFAMHNQVSAIFFWDKINTQIRIKSKIYKASEEESNNYFNRRDFQKNILAISSNQSKQISSYQEVVSKYKKFLSEINKKNKVITRPDYWGGYFMSPYCFEFWEGHSKRLNKRLKYDKVDKKWIMSVLEP